MFRHRSTALLFAAVFAAVFATAALAAKPAAGPTLTVSFSSGLVLTTGSSVPYATPYVVSGCGYNAANGGVTVVVHSPEAISFAGQMPDANGCISLSNFSTQGAGSYELDAYQQVRNKSSLVASTSFTLN
jgi:hypothetical protein